MDFGKLEANLAPKDSPPIVEILSAMDLQPPIGKKDLPKVLP
jgi:hypothetical protein